MQRDMGTYSLLGRGGGSLCRERVQFTVRIRKREQKKKASSPSLTSIRDGNKKIVDVQMSESTFPVRSLRFSLLPTERSQNTADDVMHQLEAALNCTEVELTHYHIVLVFFSSHFLSTCIKKKKKAPQPAWRCAEDNTQWDLLWSLPAVDR